MYTYVQVEPNASCPMSASFVYKNLGDPERVTMVRVYEGEPGGRLCAVTGWSSDGEGTPCDAFAIQVEDSGAGSAYVIYGGDWGIRLRPDEPPPAWGLEDPEQWGETHLVLADASDIVLARDRGRRDRD